MTVKEAAIVSAYTGILIGTFDDMQKYIEDILGRPVFTHELADHDLCELIKQKSYKDFVDIKVEG